MKPACVVCEVGASVLARSPVQNEPPIVDVVQRAGAQNENGAIQARPITSNLLVDVLEVLPVAVEDGQRVVEDPVGR